MRSLATIAARPTRRKPRMSGEGCPCGLDEACWMHPTNPSGIRRHVPMYQSWRCLQIALNRPESGAAVILSSSCAAPFTRHATTERLIDAYLFSIQAIAHFRQVLGYRIAMKGEIDDPGYGGCSAR
jgi:hypothetical protein